MDFGFIKDSVLKKRIVDSIEYIFALYEESKHSDTNKSHRTDTYRTETYRVIVLYTISSIEAILFYIYEQRKLTLHKIEYKEKFNLPDSYLHGSTKGRVVIAIETKILKKESEISLRELVQFLESVKVITNQTQKRILDLLAMRNSVHLRQNKQIPCTIKDVDEALDLLMYVIANAHKGIALDNNSRTT